MFYYPQPKIADRKDTKNFLNYNKLSTGFFNKTTGFARRFEVNALVVHIRTRR